MQIKQNKVSARINENMKILCLILSGVVLVSCNGGGGGGGGGSTPPVSGVSNPITAPTGPGYMTINVSPPGVCSYNAANIPCVTVTVCNAANTCDTVPDIILDTGSFGLRIFNQFVSDLNLPNVTSGGQDVAECVYYGDNSSNWGPIVKAKVQLADGISTPIIPIQLIDNSYPGSSTTQCDSPSITPQKFRGNGIMGVGPLVYDGGSYYTCSNGICNSASIPNSKQVANPIAMLSNPEYSNGLTLKFPGLNPGGATGAVGYAIFGIDTNSDNSVGSGVNVYPSQAFNVSNGSIPIGMPVKYAPNPSVTHGFIDTGSNFYFFTDNSISLCSNGLYYCPSNSLTVNPANQNSTGNYIATNVNILNADTLQSTNNTAFSNFGANLGHSYFDYGLPFFFNKTVYVGFTGTSSKIGSGAYWAF